MSFLLPPLQHAPINPAWMIEGTCETSARRMDDCVDSAAFYWLCVSVGSKSAAFYWKYNHDETVHIISGKANVVLQNGDPWPIELEAGSVHRFKKGEIWLWTVPEHILKFAVFTYIRPFPLRWAARLKRFIQGDNVSPVM